MSRLPLLLDVSGDATAPAGYEAVATEAEFLDKAIDPLHLLVRGKALCRWAADFCDGRGYLWKNVFSPTRELQLYCPALTDNQARQVHRLLVQTGKTPQNHLQARDVLETLYPYGPWSERPSREHAARWLLWLEEHELDPALQPLLDQLASLWEQDAPEKMIPVYAIRNGAAARTALSMWLGITRPGPERAGWGDFPLVAPPRWREQARKIWSQESVSERPRLLTQVVERRAPYEIRCEAACLTAEYFQQHVTELTTPVLASLEALLPPKDTEQMRAICKPSSPEPLPKDVGDVLKWFVDQYLPFRSWEQAYGDEEAHRAALERAAEFETWCLQFYPVALADGAGSEHLAIRRSQQLRQSRSSCVTLWVVFDGLTFRDGQTLARMLAEDPRLSLGSLSPTLSPLPTITQFCKRSVIEGLPSASLAAIPSAPSWEGAKVLKESREATGALSHAMLGDVFVWPLTQPDKTYHEKADASTIRGSVQSELEQWARTIRAAASAPPAHLALRVIFTTDHGRLLSEGARTLNVPAGMEAHGRAAYGQSSQSFDATGTKRDEAAGLVYLDKDRFRLPMDCAVALGTAVFKMSDGKTGQEWFPHGGLFPEEVLIPWCELTRDLVPPLLRAAISGLGRAGATHEALLHIENLGVVPVRATAAALSIGANKRRLTLNEIEVGPMSSLETTIEIVGWPNGQQVKEVQADIEFLLAGGSTLTVEASVALRTQEMQSARAANLLEDLF